MGQTPDTDLSVSIQNNRQKRIQSAVRIKLRHESDQVQMNDQAGAHAAFKLTRVSNDVSAIACPDELPWGHASANQLAQIENR